MDSWSLVARLSLVTVAALGPGCSADDGDQLPCPDSGCGDQPELSLSPTPTDPWLPTCSVTAGGIVLQAETFEGSWAFGWGLPGFLGDSYVTSGVSTLATATMTRTITVPETAHYVVWARGYASATADRRWRITIDGAELSPTHQQTDGEDGFVWQRAGSVDLTAGPVAITIIDAGTGPEAADAIALSTSTELDPAADEDCWQVIDPVRAAQMALDGIVLRAQAHAEQIAAATTLSEWQGRATEVRDTVATALGLDPLPDKTPLNAQLLGATQLEGYRIERVTFESRPGFLVTANVYVPDGAGPFPLVVSPIGHWMTYGKASDTPARRAHGLAALGYLTLTYDPFGQGERAIAGNEHGEHWRLVLSGHTNAGLMVWDTIRALDYLLTREDVDPDRIAITGASGGGLNTLYSSVMDPRVQVAIPAVYVCQWEDFIATGIWHCGCSHVPGLGRATNMGEMAALFAPAPQLLLDALGDPMFSTAGAQKAEAQAQVPYELYQASERLQLQSFAGGHDYGQPMREAAYGFIAQHLDGLGDGSPITEPAAPPLWVNDPAYYCYGGGPLPPGTTTVRDLALDWAETAALTLPMPTELPADQLRAALADRVQPPEDPGYEVAIPVAVAQLPAMDVTLLRVEIGRGATLPARLARPPGEPPIVVVVDGSRDRLAGLDALQLVYDAGLVAVHVATGGQGELWWGEYEQLSSNLLLGDSLAGQRAFDLIQVRRAITQWLGADNRPIGLLALGDASAFSALVAQALFGEYDALALAPLSSTLFRAFSPAGVPLQMVVADLLHTADIPHIAALASDHPLLLGFEDSDYLARYPEWASVLQQSTTINEGLTETEAISWLAEQLCFVAPASCANLPDRNP